MDKNIFNRHAWGCIFYIGNKKNPSFKIRIKSFKWMKRHIEEKGYSINKRGLEIVKLHIKLHEIGHFAYKHYINVGKEDYYEGKITEEYEAWLYASKCLKSPISILKTILITSEDAELISLLESELNPTDDELNW